MTKEERQELADKILCELNKRKVRASEERFGCATNRRLATTHKVVHARGMASHVSASTSRRAYR